MRKVFLICLAMGLLTGQVWAAATPTPSPTPSPTPFPDILPPQMRPVPVNAYLEFDWSTQSVATLTNHRTLQPLTIPTDYTLYIDAINWSCNSASDVDLKWSTAGTLIDSVRFLNEGQGKCAVFLTPKYSVRPGDHPVLYFNSSSAGVVFIDGYIK